MVRVGFQIIDVASQLASAHEIVEKFQMWSRGIMTINLILIEKSAFSTCAVLVQKGPRSEQFGPNPKVFNISLFWLAF